LDPWLIQGRSGQGWEEKWRMLTNWEIWTPNLGESVPEVVAAVLAMLRVVEYPVHCRIVWVMV